MLTRIAAATAAVTAVLNLVVLLGVGLTADQIAACNMVVVAVGGFLHAWKNPAVPFGDHP